MRMRMRKAQKAMNQRSSGKLSAGLVAVSTAIIQKAITQDILCTSDTIKRTDVEWCFKLQ
jgi:hypothetical protein